MFSIGPVAAGLMFQSPRRVLLVGGALSVVVGITGLAIGAAVTEQADWHSVAAQVVGEASHPLVSVDVDGFTYAIPDQVPYWIDSGGTTHDGGWPSCLRPNPVGDATQVPRDVPIRFTTVTVDADELKNPIVVAVDCRPS